MKSGTCSVDDSPMSFACWGSEDGADVSGPVVILEICAEKLYEGLTQNFICSLGGQEDIQTELYIGWPTIYEESGTRLRQSPCLRKSRKWESYCLYEEVCVAGKRAGEVVRSGE